MIALLAASPANAAPSGVGENVNNVSSPGGTVTGTCTFTTSLPQTSFGYLDIAVKYDVRANGPAYAVGGVCEIVDYYGTVWGTVRAAAPGMVAANADKVTMPRDVRAPQACNTPTGTWTDGTPANASHQRKCTPL